MPSIIVHSAPDKVLVQKRAIATVPAHIATFKADNWRGSHLKHIPLEHRMCQQYLYEGAKRFIERMAVRGFEYVDAYDIHVYGPFPSYDLPRTMRDISEFNADPNVAANLVKARATTVEEYADYRLVANFISRPVVFDEPAEVRQGVPGAR